MKKKGVPQYFTRHLLRAGLQCPTKLYYKARAYPEDDRIRPFLNHAGFNKYNLKKIAGRQYPGAVFVDEQSPSGAVHRTAQLLKQKSVVILEAVFLVDEYYARVPVLVKNGNTIRFFDIQTKVFNPNKHRLINHHGALYEKWKPYLIDLAYKQFVMQQLNAEWKYRPHLLLPDKTHKAVNDCLLMKLQNGNPDLREEELFCRLDVSEHVKKILSDGLANMPFEEFLETMKRRFLEAKWEQPVIGRKCRNCEFRIAPEQIEKGKSSGFHTCWMEAGQAPEYERSTPPVLDLIGPGVTNWIKQDIYLQKNIMLRNLPPLKSILKPKHAITQKQRQTLQVRKSKGRDIPGEIIKKQVFEEISRWQYPLHFLDFEAGNYAVPIRKNRRPYHLVIFQFSCHTLYANGEWSHHQWIGDGREKYPNFELVRQLKHVPDIEKGSIVQYSNFEHYALKTIRKELKREVELVEDASSLIEWLNAIVQRHDSNTMNPPYLADMSRLVKSYYYNRFMANSLSIKDVLQSILAVSSTLRDIYTKPYSSHNFDGIRWWQRNDKAGGVKSPYAILQQTQGNKQIGRGTEAMVLYGKILTDLLSLSEKKEAVNALLKYCELDTLAMLMIYQHWRTLAVSNQNILS